MIEVLLLTYDLGHDPWVTGHGLGHGLHRNQSLSALSQSEHFLQKMSQLYTIADVRFFITRRLGKSIPPDTLKRWKRILGVTAQKSGGDWLYEQDDIDALVTLGKWLRTPNATINGFCRHHNFTRKDK
ncbi:hypothetical protein IQ266_18840 [filamentous cyanobacterium LEGE 11480]|uniref:Uncharacterized protein n=1 Tax=Romeriopsis navalis LEGE 11480 TaxID=2777977 RepID=A0A928VSM3_9CYAN|nr:hypothetical protein [Romeriopsis navalis]MBE9031795.1 hypothetical protein [Romeriopsis navalis LEGE 11480]